MRILLAGTPALVLPIFEAVSRSEIEVTGVLTNKPRPRGRSGTPIPTPVSLWAQENSYPVHHIEEFVNNPSLLESIDLVLVVAFGQLIPKSILGIPRCGWANVHFSHLPEARGAAPVQRLIAAGRSEIGYSLFRLDEGMDTGPVYHRSELFHIAGLTTGQAWRILTDEAATSIVELLHEIGEGKVPIAQPEYLGEIPLAPKVTSQEAQIDWLEASEEIERKIRAFNPAPSAWTTFRGERFIIHLAEVASDQELEVDGDVKVGKISRTVDGVLVRSGTGFIRCIEVQPSGKRVMNATDWARGIANEDELRFE